MRVFFERDLVQRSIEAVVRDVIVNGNRSVGLEGERAKVLHYLRPPLVISLGHAREPRSFFRTHPSFLLGTPVVGTTDAEQRTECGFVRPIASRHIRVASMI
jgi:hypothetical protein